MAKPAKLMGNAARQADDKAQRRKIRKENEAHAERSVVGKMQPLPSRARKAADVVRQEAEYRGASNHRVLSPLDVYLGRKAITTRQYNAGQALYNDWAFGICGARDGDAGSSGGPGDGMSFARMCAVESFNGALSKLDDAQRDLVMTICCHEVTVTELVARDGTKETPEAMFMRVRAALSKLGDGYRLPVETSTETLRITVRLPVRFQPAPDGTIEILSVNGVACGLKAPDEVEAMKVAQIWANDWARKRLEVIRPKDTRG